MAQELAPHLAVASDEKRLKPPTTCLDIPGMEFVWRFLAGGSVIALLPIISKRLGDGAAGLAAMIPAVTLVGFIFIGMDQGTIAVWRATRAALLGLAAVAAFLGTVLYASAHGRGWGQALFLGVGSWLGMAALVYAALKEIME